MKIDDLIKERKDELHIEKAPTEAWEFIRQNWKKHPKSQVYWWRVAAAVLFGLSICLLVRNQLLQDRVTELASLSDLSKKYQAIEKDYLRQVNELQMNLPLNKAKKTEDLQWIFEELQLLEEVNTLYRKDIGKVKEEDLVGVLIDYYEKKINLLQKLELEIERTQNLEKDETMDSHHLSI
ncbi:MAG: hypothetical protein AAF600_13920 [Bacteroidota bacterium]